MSYDWTAEAIPSSPLAASNWTTENDGISETQCWRGFYVLPEQSANQVQYWLHVYQIIQNHVVAVQYTVPAHVNMIRASSPLKTESSSFLFYFYPVFTVLDLLPLNQSDHQVHYLQYCPCQTVFIFTARKYHISRRAAMLTKSMHAHGQIRARLCWWEHIKDELLRESKSSCLISRARIPVAQKYRSQKPPRHLPQHMIFSIVYT